MSNVRRMRQLNIALFLHGEIRVVTEAGTFTLFRKEAEQRDLVRLNEGRIEIKPHEQWDWFPVIDHLECAWVKSEN